MKRSALSPYGLLPVVVSLLFGFSTVTFAQTGHVLNGVGPMDQGWSGAGMANPQDALTGLHWNPATLTTFDASTLDFSLQLLFPTSNVASSVNQGAFGENNPPITLEGTTASTAGPFPIPAIGYVHRPHPTRWAFGISTFGVGGFGVDYEVSAPTSSDGNPITFPQRAGGFGALNSSFALFQVAPTVAYQLSDKISVGGAPTLNVGLLEVNPFPAASPDQNGYPDGPQSTAFGAGFQVGVHAHDLSGFHAGLSFKSTQYFADYTFEPDGRSFSFNLDYPMILSAALGYSGFERFELAVDVRYIDFQNTDGFRTAGFDQSGAVTGFGWNSIFAAALGVQYDLTERLPVRLGYAFNENPIDDEMAFYNVASPAIVQHHLSGGFSYRLTPTVTVSAALQYAPRNEVAHQMQNPQLLQMLGTTAVPGTRVESELSTLTAVIGASVRL